MGARGGLVYRLSDEVSLYGSYTRSFKPNSTIAPLSTGETIDSAILPEEATSWELGAKLDVPGVSAAPWRCSTSARRTCWSTNSTVPATAACAPPAGSARAAWSWTSPASSANAGA